MMKRPAPAILFWITLATVILLSGTTAQAVGVGVNFQYWYPSFSGDLRGDGGGTKGTVMDMENDLGLDDEGAYAIEASGQFGRHHLTFAYTYFDWSGDETLGRAVVFDGATYAAGSRVQTDLKFHTLDFEYQYDFFKIDTVLAGLSAGAIAKLKYVEGDVSLESAANDRKKDFSYPIPMVGLAAHVGLIANILEARGKVTGITYSDTTVYEADAGISLTAIPFTDIAVGYRYVNYDVDDDGVLLKTQLSGPYVSLTVGF